MKVLVLGGNGFIGSHVVDSLLKAGHRVSVFDRCEDVARKEKTNIDYIIGDFRDTSCLARALDGINVVFHAISTTVPSTSNIDPIFDVESNLVATLNLLNLMKQMDITRIVYLSSGGTVYGESNSYLISENHVLNPICSYGVVKACIENYLSMYGRLYGLQPIVLRPSNPYGPRQGNFGIQGVIGTFLSKIHTNKNLEIWGDGTVIRDFIYVGDLAQICLKAIESNIVGVFNVGGGRGHSINEVLETIKLVTGKNFEVANLPPRAFDLNRVVLDITNARNAFDWQPQTPLYKGILEAWNGLSAK